MELRPEQAAVRPYRQADREAVMRLAADSAAFGAPVEAFLDDRRLFCDAVYRWSRVVASKAGSLDGSTEIAEVTASLRSG